jgi:MFS family permease
MSHRQLTALILASALITLDGTATTIALPAIGRELSATMARLQWIANAPLLALSAMLLPAGTIGDRFGHVRVLRIGLMIFVAASAVCAAAQSDGAIIAARLGQGVGGALMLPSVLAVLRAAYDDAAERTRVFGTWAAWTGAASAVGPLLAGIFVDILSWRAMFVTSMMTGTVAAVLLKRDLTRGVGERCESVPAGTTAALVGLLGAAAYALMEGARTGLMDALVLLPAGVAVACGVALVRDARSRVLLPRELLSARNCMAANATDFALYFGMFGLSFMLAVYAQQVLHYSALWSAVALLPISIMLLLAERFGRLTPVIGTRPLAIGGALTASGAIAWIGSAPHPIPFWSHMILGTTMFGLGMSIAVSSLTHAAVAAVPESCAGAASGLNHAVVRTAGLIAVAVLGSIGTPGASEAISAEGFHSAMLVCAAVVAAGGLAGSVQLRDHEAGGLTASL